MTRRNSTSLFAITLSAALLQCGHESSSAPAASPPAPEPAAANTPPSEPMQPASGTMSPSAEQSTTPPAATAQEAPTPAPMSDAQIFKVIDLANAAEIDQAKIAQTKARHAKVKSFASMMVSQHGKAKDKAIKLSTKLAMQPADSPASSQLKSDAETMTASLKGAPAADFDRTYMTTQVEAHEQVLAALDDKLIPAAQDPELKALLQDMRTTVESHLTQARQIGDELNAAGAKR